MYVPPRATKARIYARRRQLPVFDFPPAGGSLRVSRARPQTFVVHSTSPLKGPGTTKGGALGAVAAGRGP